VRQRHLEAHKHKVARSRSQINNQWSVREETKLQPTRHRNAKKDQVTEERYANIEKENRRLLTRMQEIERKGSQKAAANLVLGGNKPARSGSLPAAGSRAGARQKEMKRIDAENQRLLKRLQGAKAAVNMSKFDQEHKAQQRYMKMRCEHQKEDWLLERAQQQALLAAQMAVRAASRAVPPPISKEPPGPTDAECMRLLRLQDDLRRRAGEELEDEDALSQDMERDVDLAMDEDVPHSPVQDQGQPKPRARLIGQYAGCMPESSQTLVDQLMAQYAQLQQEDEEDTEAAVAEAKAAAAAAFRKAEALDIASDDAVLNYEKVVETRRRREQAALLEYGMSA